MPFIIDNVLNIIYDWCHTTLSIHNAFATFERRKKMRKSIIAMLLTIAMVLCLFSGCANSSPSPSGDSTSAAAVSAAVSGGGSEAPSSGAPESVAVAGAVSYPLNDGVTLTLWKVFSSFIWGELMSSYEQMPSLPIIEEKTGVKLDFLEPSDSAATEQFNLMIVSGDYPDLVGVGQYYTGGTTMAYQDGVCLDLTDLLPANAPDFYALVQNLDDYSKKTIYNEEDQILALTGINDSTKVYRESGLAARYDWLEQWGMEVPTTVEGLYQYAKMAKAEYDCAFPIFIDNSSVTGGFTQAFGIPGFSIGMSDLALMMNGKTVESSVSSDNFKKYIEYINKIYSEGLVAKDFYSATYGPDYINAFVSADGCAVCNIMGDKFETMRKAAKDPDFKFAAIPNLVLNEGDTYQFQPKTSQAGGMNGSISISTCCQSPETALKYLNWFFTKEGSLLSTYGIEDKTYTLDADGNPQFTDFVLNNPDGFNLMTVKNCYTNPILPSLGNQEALYNTYADYQKEAMELWAEGGDECSMPTLSLSGEEASEYAALATDISSYVSETVLKWMVGEEVLTDEAWSAYKEQLKTMGINRALEIYQGAYDRLYK